MSNGFKEYHVKLYQKNQHTDQSEAIRNCIKVPDCNVNKVKQVNARESERYFNELSESILQLTEHASPAPTFSNENDAKKYGEQMAKVITAVYRKKGWPVWGTKVKTVPLGWGYQVKFDVDIDTSG